MSVSRRRRLVTTISVLAAIVIGLAVVDRMVDGETTSPGDTATSELSRPDEPAAEGGGEAVTELGIVDFAFDPAASRIGAGRPLTIVNHDEARHTFTSATGDGAGVDFDITLGPGASDRLVLEKPGSYEYICRIHPGMTGTLDVVAQ